MSAKTGHSYEFGNFRLDPSAKILFCENKPVPLTPKVFDTLQVFVEHAGLLLEKDDLMQKIWHDRFVEESNLTVQIAALRRVLGEAPGGDRWIETMPRRGYRFVGPVVTQEENGLAAAPPQIDAVRDAAPERQGDPGRRQITAMSCELVGVPARAEGAALEGLHELVGAFQRRVSETVGRHDGSSSTSCSKLRSKKRNLSAGWGKASPEPPERCMRLVPAGPMTASA